MPTLNTNEVYLERNEQDLSALRTHIKSLKWCEEDQSKPGLGFSTAHSVDSSTRITIELELDIVVECGRVYEYKVAFAKDSFAKTVCEVGKAEAKLRVEGIFRVMYLSDPEELPERAGSVFHIALITERQSR